MCTIIVQLILYLVKNNVLINASDVILMCKQNYYFIYKGFSWQIIRDWNWKKEEQEFVTVNYQLLL